MDFDWEKHPAFTEQLPINQSIAELLVALIRESWLAAELRLDFGAEDGAVVQRIVNPDTNEEWPISNELAEAVRQLGEHRRKFAFTWKTAVYGVRYNEDSGWKISATFQ